GRPFSVPAFKSSKTGWPCADCALAGRSAINVSTARMSHPVSQWSRVRNVIDAPGLGISFKTIVLDAMRFKTIVYRAFELVRAPSPHATAEGANQSVRCGYQRRA